jgi:DNA-binding PadR family transcriptional regulator
VDWGFGMPGPRWRAGDFDPGVFEMLSCAGGLLAHLRRAKFLMCAAGAGAGGCGAGTEGGAGGFWGRAWTGGKGPGPKAGPWGGGPWGGGSGPMGGGWWTWAGFPGPPGAGRPTKAGRGDVRAAILALLQERPRTGYQIMSDIAERSGGAWKPSPGAVYPALAQLADEGLIVGEESNGRRTFSLTDAGRAYVEENPDMARGAWESRTQQEAWQPPGLFAEAARLAGGIVQIAHAGTPEQVRAAEQLLEQTRRRLYQILADDDEDEETTDADATADADEPDGGEHGNDE